MTHRVSRTGSIRTSDQQELEDSWASIRQACHAVRPDKSRRLALDEVFSPPNRHGFEAGMDVERPQYVADVVPHRLRAEV